jgi:hypothetical protein
MSTKSVKAISCQLSAFPRSESASDSGTSSKIGYPKMKHGILSSAVCRLPFAVSRLLAALTLLLFFSAGFGQTNGHEPSDNRGDANFRRKANIDGNNVRATVFNGGYSGRTTSRPDEVAYEWPKNTNRVYVALLAIWKAGEVVDESGRTIQIFDAPTFRNAPSGESWSLEPVPGFVNPDANSIARSDRANTWPGPAQGGWRDKREDTADPGWVESWNGFFGKNVFNADQEMFYRTSDDLYDRFNYVPDTGDPTRRGLGLLMDVRAFAWSQVLISDVVFFIHDILNDGTKRIPKASFAIWLADIVGGDAQDDQPFVDLQTSMAFMTDADRIGDQNFGSDPVGVASIRYLETPGNPVDGIDNDGDADFNPSLLNRINGDPSVLVPLFTVDNFVPRTIVPGDKIVLIDSLSFERRVIEYPQGGGTVVSLGQVINLPENGMVVAEDTVANSLDEDLDGLIDERETLHLNRFDDISGTVRPVRYINYLTFAVGDTIKRGFIVPGKAAPQSYENVAPMIDESRDDGFDNDNDWLALQDDLGLDGVENTGDPGEGNGVPTSGSGTNFPGEANIDKTDVSETDMIGLTTAVQDPAFGINFNTIADATIWRNFMTPGRFFLPRPTGEYDTFVSSGFFPIEPGQRQRMAVSVAMAGGGITKNADIQSAITKQNQARTAFETDYQFVQAPNQLTLTAVPGDRKVTLYWDDVAEFSEDRFIKRLGGIFQDFEGYRVYRSTDAALLESRTITDGQGEPRLLRPIAQFDKNDGFRGYHPVDINGVLFDLGQDTGLKHAFTDTGLVNGQRYFYVVTAYDFGVRPGQITSAPAFSVSPTESPINIDVDVEGNITVGSNVAVVRPRAPVAGYLPAGVTELTHAQGTSSGQIGFNIVDPRTVKDGHEYEMTFQDTLIRRITGDILTTKNFTLTDRTDNVVKLFRSPLFAEGQESPLIDGFRLSFVNEERVQVNAEASRWSATGIYNFQFSPVQFLLLNGEQRPNDYQVIFGEIGIATSKDTTIRSGTTVVPLPAKPVNFQVIDFNTKEPVTFAFAELNGTDGKFSTHPTNANLTDAILFLEPNAAGQLVWTWQVILRNVPRENRNPEAGDTLSVLLRKPFLSGDVYRFTIQGEKESVDLAREELNRIKVVPNPYVAAAGWEPRNTFSSGRGTRKLAFIHLPRRCTIRIFNVNGVLIDTLEHPADGSAELDDGEAEWDMLSKDEFEIAYGIYVYHIDAPGIGQKTGTFAIIK